MVVDGGSYYLEIKGYSCRKRLSRQPMQQVVHLQQPHRSFRRATRIGGAAGRINGVRP